MIYIPQSLEEEVVFNGNNQNILVDFSDADDWKEGENNSYDIVLFRSDRDHKIELYLEDKLYWKNGEQLTQIRNGKSIELGDWNV